MGQGYNSFDQALKYLNLESLENRKIKLCLKFAKKALKHEKFKSWFKLADKKHNTRHEKSKFYEVNVRCQAFKVV